MKTTIRNPYTNDGTRDAAPLRSTRTAVADASALARGSREASLALLTTIALAIATVAFAPLTPVHADRGESGPWTAPPEVAHRTVEVDGQTIFYREAGPRNAPTVLLLHGFPTSSHMFRDLIPALADRYHVVAPDYPGYGNSSMPSVDEFEYTFDRLAGIVETFTEKLGLERYSLYLMDYGAPVGFRLATAHPERVETLIVQNGNAYVEGIDNDFWSAIRAYWKDREAIDAGMDNPFWQFVKQATGAKSLTNEQALRFLVTFDATKWQYTNGVRDVATISPDNWHVTQRLLDRPGNADIQLRLFYDYGSNPPLYPKWQAYLREHQPPTLVVWGANDAIFPAAGAHPYKRDLKNVEFHLLDTGHFALEEDLHVIASEMRDFLGKYAGRPKRDDR